MIIYLIGGARPNFVKLAALSKAFASFKKTHPRSKVQARIVHTGQHYDPSMAKVFFRELGMPAPYVNLEVGSSSHAVQTATIMTRFEELLSKKPADAVLVVGDVNSTMACSLVASKLGIPVIHVEAGLRSRDRSMPEEINRLVTDVISDYLFTTSRDADLNLKNEGISAQKIFFVGNVMVDTLLANLHKAKSIKSRSATELKKPYAVLTLHRPSNVDKDADFKQIVDALDWIQKKIPIIFPVHPRTQTRLSRGSLGKRLQKMKNLKMIPPASYLEFMGLLQNANLALTDSGGIQEETTILGIPCLTLRDNTERPVTITSGTNVLAGRQTKRIIQLADEILSGRRKISKKRPAYWDGKAATRIVKILSEKLGF